jgi:hypothetical protein
MGTTTKPLLRQSFQDTYQSSSRPSGQGQYKSEYLLILVARVKLKKKIEGDSGNDQEITETNKEVEEPPAALRSQRLQLQTWQPQTVGPVTRSMSKRNPRMEMSSLPMLLNDISNQDFIRQSKEIESHNSNSNHSKISENSKNTDESHISSEAHLVAQGFTQTFGVDYDKTYAPMVRMTSLRTICAIAAHNDWSIHKLDVDVAYLNADLENQVYMQKPPVYFQYDKDKVVLLKKCICSLKRLGKEW